MLEQFALRGRAGRRLMLAIVGPLALGGVLVAPGVLLIPLGSVRGMSTDRSWMLGAAGVSLCLLAALFVLALRTYRARLTILGEGSVDHILLLCGVVFWTVVAIPLYLYVHWR